MRKVLFSSVLGALCWIMLAAPVWAAGQGERVGENVGDLLGGWAKSLYVGIAGLVALMFLLNRRFADLMLFMVAATVVGGFVMATNEVANTVRDIWRTITG